MIRMEESTQLNGLNKKKYELQGKELRGKCIQAMTSLDEAIVIRTHNIPSC